MVAAYDCLGGLNELGTRQIRINQPTAATRTPTRKTQKTKT